MKFDKTNLKKCLQKANEFITDLFNTNDVPVSLEDDNFNDSYLVDNNTKTTSIVSSQSQRAQNVNELEERMNIIKNKMKSKKQKISERGLKKREAKKIKKNKEIKKIVATAQKSIKNGNIKIESSSSKPKIENLVRPVFNEDGKIVFSKFDFASHPGIKTKKSKNEKTIRNPKQILQQLKETDKKMTELREAGEEDKVKELKQELAWKKVFDKVQGKKIKDDPKLLHKAIKKKKDQKLKSKKKWTERKEKVEQTISQRQKKRDENINKKLKEKKHKKLKKLSKKGRVIPGF